MDCQTKSAFLLPMLILPITAYRNFAWTHQTIINLKHVLPCVNCVYKYICHDHVRLLNNYMSALQGSLRHQLLGAECFWSVSRWRHIFSFWISIVSLFSQLGEARTKIKHDSGIGGLFTLLIVQFKKWKEIVLKFWFKKAFSNLHPFGM